jgi:Sec-independent protein translocase protein TatA
LIIFGAGKLPQIGENMGKEAGILKQLQFKIQYKEDENVLETERN